LILKLVLFTKIIIQTYEIGQCKLNCMSVFFEAETKALAVIKLCAIKCRNSPAKRAFINFFL
jgi:hypothetical protein